MEKYPLKRKGGLVGAGGRQKRERGESNQNALCMCMKLSKKM